MGGRSEDCILRTLTLYICVLNDMIIMTVTFHSCARPEPSVHNSVTISYKLFIYHNGLKELVRREFQILPCLAQLTAVGT